jgi:lipoprotein-releasing system ATP-binding protein
MVARCARDAAARRVSLPLLDINGLQHKLSDGSRLTINQWQVPPFSQWQLSTRSNAARRALMLCISGLLRPDAGRIILLGDNIVDAPERDNDRLRGDLIGFVADPPVTPIDYGVAQWVRLSRQMSGKAISEQGLVTALRSTEIEARADERLSRLAPLDRAKVSLAAAVVRDARLLLVDLEGAQLSSREMQAFASLLLRNAALLKAALVMLVHEPWPALDAASLFDLDAAA